MIGKQLTQVDTLNDVVFFLFAGEPRITASLTHADLMVSPKARLADGCSIDFLKVPPWDWHGWDGWDSWDWHLS